MSEFIKKLTTAPIYHPIENPEKVDVLGHPTNAINSDWQKWFQQAHNILASNEFYGNPSVCLNSDFNWNNGVATPVTQASGDFVFFSEEWQVVGASNATYTITQTPFPANDTDQVGSITFIKMVVTSWNGNELFLYQAQLGSQFLRRYQARDIIMSSKIINNSQDTIELSYEIFYNYDPTTAIFEKSTMHLEPGVNELATSITTTQISPISVGGAPLVEFRLRFVNLPNDTADLDIIYIKAEMADRATPLYVDHALERVRIDN